MCDIDSCESDEESRVIYNLIRDGRIENLESFIGNFRNNDNQTVHSILSENMEELKLRNVPISKRMEIFVTNKILDYRFFKDAGEEKNVKPNIENVKERLQLICDYIDLIESDYSDLKPDPYFILVSTFIAQSIHVVKRFLKVTYSIVPWEEMQFCLVVFISCCLHTEDMDSAYSMVLDQKRLISYLTEFNKLVQTLKLNLQEKDLNSKYPLPKKGMSSPRESVMFEISKNPVMKKLYNDYAIIRSVYSLRRMEVHLKVAQNINLNDESITSHLVIQRALQVIGECMKNTLESPNVSEDIHRSLVETAPQNLRSIISSLRDDLSHAKTLIRKLSVEELTDRCFHNEIQNDLKKVYVEVTSFLYKKRYEALIVFAEKVTNAETLAEVKELFVPINLNNLEEVRESYKSPRELETIESLVAKFKRKVTKIDPSEEIVFLFDMIESALAERKEKLQNYRTSHVTFVSDLSSRVRNGKDLAAVKNIFQGLRLREPKHTEDFSQILAGVAKIFDKTEPKSAKLHRLFEKIWRVVSFEVNKISAVDDLRTRINEENELEEQAECEVNKIIQRLLNNVVDNKISNKIQQKREVYHTKRQLISLLREHSLQTIDDQTFVKIVKRLHNKTIENKLIEFKKSNSEHSCRLLINRANDDYGEFITNIKKIESPFSVDKKIQAVEKFVSVLNKNLLSRIDSISLEYKDKNTVYFEKRLEKMKALIGDMDELNVVNKIKENLEFRMAFEMLLLDIVEVLENSSVFVENKFFLDEYSPLLIGTNLRNYLAHCDPLFDVLPIKVEDHIVLNAFKILSFGSNLLIDDRRIGRTTDIDVYGLKHRYARNLNTFNNQQKIFLNITEFSCDKIKASRNDGADLFGRDEHLWTLLHYATQADDVETFQYCLKENLDIKNNDKYGTNCYDIAALCGSIKVLQRCFDIIKNISVQSRRLTLLHFSALSGCDETVRMISPIANVNAKDFYGTTPLHLAALGGDKTIPLLLANGADVNAINVQGFTPLHYAAKFNNSDGATVLLKNGAIVDTKNIFNCTPLHLAALHGKAEVFATLLNSGADVNINTNNNVTVVHLLAQSGNVQILDMLLEMGVPIDRADDDMWTPLHVAAREGHNEFVEILLKKGANVNAGNYILHHCTALHAAAYGGYYDVVLTLLRNGAYINATNLCKETPLHLAIKKGHADIVLKLLEAGADATAPDQYQETPLHCAALYGHNRLVNVLLDHPSVNANATNNRKFTALDMAISYNSKDVVTTLLNHTDLSGKATGGITPLHTASLYGNQEIVEMLLPYLDVNVRDGSGSTPLDVAAMHGHKSVVELLIRNGAEVNTVSCSGDGAMHEASKYGFIEIIKILLNNGANINGVGHQGLTPVLTAACSYNEEVVRFLINNGARVNARDERDQTCLHKLAYFGDKKGVKFLINVGAVVNAVDVDGNTPLQLAAQVQNVEAVKILLENGALLNKNVFGRTALHSTLSNKNTTSGIKAEIYANINTQGENLCLPQFGDYEEFIRTLSCSGNNLKFKPIIEAFRAHVHVSGVYTYETSKVSYTNEITSLIQFQDDAFVQCLITSILSLYTEQELVDNSYKLNKEDKDELINSLKEKDKETDLFENDTEILIHTNHKKEYSTTKFHRIKHITLKVSAAIMDQIFNSYEHLFIEISVNLDKLQDVKRLTGGDSKVVLYVQIFSPRISIVKQSGGMEIAKLLIQHGANVSEGDASGTTPLHFAAANGYREITEILFDKGVDPLALNVDKMTPFHAAASKGCFEIVKIFIENGADVNVKYGFDATPLHHAALTNHRKIVKLLLDNHAEVNLGRSPLHYAVLLNHQSIVKLLLDYGADVNRMINMDENDSDPTNRCTPLHLAVSKGYPDLVKMLIENGAQVDLADDNSRTPLHMAVVGQHYETVQTLLENDAEIDVIDFNNVTPLTCAVLFVDVATVKLLLEKGADVNGVENSIPPLHAAVVVGHVSLVELLLNSGADVNAVALHNLSEKESEDDNAETLDEEPNMVRCSTVHLAVQNGCNEILLVLLQRGANVDIRDSRNKTPLDYALVEEDQDIVDILLKHIENA